MEHTWHCKISRSLREVLHKRKQRITHTPRSRVILYWLSGCVWQRMAHETNGGAFIDSLPSEYGIAGHFVGPLNAHDFSFISEKTRTGSPYYCRMFSMDVGRLRGRSYLSRDHRCQTDASSRTGAEGPDFFHRLAFVHSVKKRCVELQHLGRYLFC
jgi:hypothetical protein